MLGPDSQVVASFGENGIEPVSDIAYRKNAAAFWAELVPQAADMHIDRACLEIRILTQVPHRFE